MSNPHATHCCPRHGCKYRNSDTECFVATGVDDPVYPNNNGCEACEDEIELLFGRTVWLWWNRVYSTLSAIEKEYNNSTTVFKSRDGELYAITYSPIDEQGLAGHPYTTVYGWCNLQKIEVTKVK